MKKLFLFLAAVLPLAASHANADFIIGRERAFAGITLDNISVQSGTLATVEKPVKVQLMQKDGAQGISAFTVQFGTAPSKYFAVGSGVRSSINGDTVYTGTWTNTTVSVGGAKYVGTVTAPGLGSDYEIRVSELLNDYVVGTLVGSGIPEFFALTE